MKFVFSFLCSVMFYFEILVVLVLFAVDSECLIRRWKYTNNILDPKNWVGRKPSDNCKGVFFPYQLGAVGTISKLYADEVVLPFSGEIEIKDGGFIEIAENSPCIHIKQLVHHHWLSPDSWESTNNSAVPDVERVPCMEDDVIFPTDDTVAVYYPEIPVQVHSLKIGKVDMTNEAWQLFLQTDFGDNQFLTLDDIRTTGIKIQPVMCVSAGGCFCHGLDDLLPWVCEKVAKIGASCFDPVTPIGHCNEICGAVIHLRVEESFILSKLESKIPKYENVDVHVSKVLQEEKALLQVVFVDKQDYNEYSTTAGYDFHKQILKDMKGLGITTAVLYKSGMRLPEGSSWLTIVWGTLLGSLMLCGIIYLTYMGSLRNYNVLGRLPIREISFRNIRPMWFSRFENREDGRVSMAASFISLGKAFDNPMYDVHRPSTSSDAVDAVALIDAGATTSKSMNEYPLHSTEQQYIEVVDIIKEGESSSTSE